MVGVFAPMGLERIDVSHRIGANAQAVFDRLRTQLAARTPANRRRSDYYDMKNAFKDLGIAVPPNLRNLDAAMGWPAKAVDMLARRVRFADFVLPGAETSEFGIDEIKADNSIPSLVEQATTSALIHSTAFILTTVDAGKVSITCYDAFNATGLFGRDGLRYGLVCLSVNDAGAPSSWLLLSEMSAARIFKNSRGVWDAEITHHMLGAAPLQALVYRPRLGRPFGSSRISRAVMSLTDSAIRTVVRAEIGAEFFSAPQRYLLGVDQEAFAASNVWNLITGRILALSDATDDSGERIQIGQFPQISMTPHTEQMKMWAELFAAETSLPVSALGVEHANPASAEAINAAKEDLVIEAEGCAESFTRAWARAVAVGVQWRDGLDEMPAVLRGLSVRWRDASTPSRAQTTDAIMKQIQAGVLPADSEVALEALGYSAADIERIKTHRENQAAGDPLMKMAAAMTKQTLTDQGI